MAQPDQFDSALDLLRRLNPAKTSTNLTAITALVPDLTEDLLSSVDQPFEVRRCKKTGRDYLLCDYNRDGDSYRSPWSNEFEPELSDGTLPSARCREMEVRCNEGFDVYRELYYEGGVSSVYLWDVENEGFAGVILLKKSVGQQSKSEGAWDSIHVFEALDHGRTTHYKLTSTVILQMGTASESLGSMKLSGNLTRQQELDMVAENDAAHVANIGKLVEDMELKMRNLLQEVYFGKGKPQVYFSLVRKPKTDATATAAKDVVGDLRSLPSLSEANRDKATHREMISSMNR